MVVILNTTFDLIPEISEVVYVLEELSTSMCLDMMQFLCRLPEGHNRLPLTGHILKCGADYDIPR